MAIARRGESYLSTVGRPGRFFIIRRIVRQVSSVQASRVHYVDLFIAIAVCLESDIAIAREGLLHTVRVLGGSGIGANAGVDHCEPGNEK
jgi:hypothetical protein